MKERTRHREGGCGERGLGGGENPREREEETVRECDIVRESEGKWDSDRK